MKLAYFRIAGSYDDLLALDEQYADLRLASVAAFGSATAPKFAAIWLQLPTRKRTIRLHHLELVPGMLPVPVAASLDIGTTTFSATLISGTESATKVPRSPHPFGPSAGATVLARAQTIVVVYEALKPRLVTGKVFSLSVAPKPTIIQSSDRGDLWAATATCTSFDVLWPVNQDTTPYFLGVRYAEPFQLDDPLLSLAAYGIYSLGTVAQGRDGIRDSENMQAVQRGWSFCRQAVPAPKSTGGRREVVIHGRSETLVRWPSDITQPFDGGFVVDGPMLQGELTSNTGTRAKQGFWPIHVGANGTGNQVRFCVTYAPWGKFDGKPKYFTVIDGVAGPANPWTVQTTPPTGSPTQSSKGGSPGVLGQPTTPATGKQAALQALDAAFKSEMQTGPVHHAQLAVAKNGKLKLLRSYTWAESGWPVTLGKHRFRWASVCKSLTGIRAASMGYDFLHMPIAQALDMGDLSVFGADPTHAAHFADAKIIDLLRQQSGFDRAYPMFNLYWRDGRKSLPLQPGDAARGVRNSKLEFAKLAPRTQQIYTNANFHLVAEAISRSQRGDFGLYAIDAHDWWKLPAAIEAIQIQDSREKALSNGEIPARDGSGYARDTLLTGNTRKEARNLGEDQPVVPRSYADFGGRDATSANGSTGFSMSAAAMVAILQIMHPGGSRPMAPSLTVEQRNRLLQTNPVGGAAATSFPPGFDSVQQVAFGNGLAVRLAKNGGDPATRSDVFHFVMNQDASGGDSVSVAMVGCSSQYRISSGDVLAQISALEAMGAWDDDVDLFPMFT